MTITVLLFYLCLHQFQQYFRIFPLKIINRYSAMINNELKEISTQDEGNNKPFASSPRMDDWWSYYPGLKSEGKYELKPFSEYYFNHK